MSPADKTLASRQSHIVVAAIVAVICVGAATAIWLRTRAATDLNRFWAPVLNSPAPVSLCVAYADPGNQLAGAGDLIAASRLTAMLARMDRPYRLQIGNDVSTQAPAILIVHSSSTQWRFGIDALNATITDQGRPTAFIGHGDEDYAIVSRVFQPDSQMMVVELAGIGRYGAEAASDLLTNANLMASGLREAPADWPGKNLQLVIRVKVSYGIPGSPTVVAAHFW